MTDSDYQLEQRIRSEIMATGPSPLPQLLELGVSVWELDSVVGDAAKTYSYNRRAPGTIVGAFGSTFALEIYRNLARIDVLDLDFQAFHDGVATTIDELAGVTGCTTGPVGEGLRGLIKHGFVERIRVGRFFRFKPLIPAVGLIELAVREIEHGKDPEREAHRQKWQRVLDHFTSEDQP